MTRIRTLLATALTLSILIPKAGLASNLQNVTITSTATQPGGVLVVQVSGSRIPVACGASYPLQYAILSSQKTMIAQALLAQTSGASVDITGANSCDSTAPSIETLSTLTMRPPPAPAWSLANRPAVPDPRDDEFDGPTFVGWTNIGTRDDTNLIDPYAQFNTASTWRNSWNSMRPGWLMIQPSYDGSLTGIQKTVAWNTNDLVYLRISTNHALSNYTYTSSNRSVRIAVTSDVGGSKFVAFGLNFPNTATGETAPQVRLSTEAGGSAAWFSLASNNNLGVIEYLCLHKIGTLYHAWIMASNGSWSYVGDVMNANAMNYIWLYTSNGGAPPTNQGNPIMGFDFVRFRATATSLP
jgi:hypothetical protein